jgi:hypothetical protein
MRTTKGESNSRLTNVNRLLSRIVKYLNKGDDIRMFETSEDSNFPSNLLLVGLWLVCHSEFLILRLRVLDQETVSIDVFVLPFDRLDRLRMHVSLQCQCSSLELYCAHHQFPVLHIPSKLDLTMCAASKGPQDFILVQVDSHLLCPRWLFDNGWARNRFRVHCIDVCAHYRSLPTSLSTSGWDPYHISPLCPSTVSALTEHTESLRYIRYKRVSKDRTIIKNNQSSWIRFLPLVQRLSLVLEPQL